MHDPTIAKTKISTVHGRFDFWCFNFGPGEQDNILVLECPSSGDTDPLCRIQSACYTAEIFRSVDCDCHEQLEESQRRIALEGGFLLYLLCDGRGAGLLHKIRGLELTRIEGIDTAAAYERLGLSLDPRSYDRVATVLRHLGVLSVRLLTNNPRKLAGLSTNGIRVAREPLEILATPNSRFYLRSKWHKLGHLLHQFDAEENDSGREKP